MSAKRYVFFAFLANFPLGILLGAVGALLLSMAIDDSISETVQKNWMYLFTFVGSLLASSVAVSGVIANIQNGQRLADEARKRKLVAARALLPSALSRICDIADQGAEAALSVLNIRTRPPEERKLLRDSMEAPKEIIAILKDCIEHSDGVSGTWLTLLLAHLQIANSRMLSSHETPGLIIPAHQTTDRCMDWIVIKGFAEHLLDFARIGREPEDYIIKSSFKINIHSDRQFFNEQLGKSYQGYIEHCESNGGLSAEAFANRLDSR